MRAKRPLLLALTLLSSGCVSAPTDPPREDEGDVCAAAARPISGARLLTRREYARTVQDLLGLTSVQAEQAAANFPREPRVEGFDNNATSHVANPLLVEQLALAAKELTADVRLRGFAALAPCTTAGTECADEFIRTFGRRAFRRALLPAEAESYLALYQALVSELGEEEAMLSIVEAMLLSPQFLYRIETRLEGTFSPPPGATLVPLGPYELASKLSYFLWGSMPDEELLLAAETGALSSVPGVEAQAKRMLAHPHAKEQVRDFHTAWLGLDQMGGLMRSGGAPEAPLALEESLLLFLDSVFWAEDGNVSDLLLSPVVFTDARIGALYGGPVGPLMEPFEAPMRRGLLTQPGLLTLLAQPDQSSPIRRGVFVREKLLCDPVPAPPPDVDNTPPDPDPTLTTRERFRVHTEQPSCAGCHQLIDPVGFTFEGYDHLGRHRTEEFGLPIDTSGELWASPDPALDAPLEDALDLAERLSTSPVVTRCIAEKWATFAQGRPTSEADECSLDFVAEQADHTGGSLREILLGIATSQMFRFRSLTGEEIAP